MVINGCALRVKALTECLLQVFSRGSIPTLAPAMQVALEVYGEDSDMDVYFGIPSPLGLLPAQQRPEAVPLLVAEPGDACFPLSSRHLAGTFWLMLIFHSINNCDLSLLTAAVQCSPKLQVLRLQQAFQAVESTPLQVARFWWSGEAAPSRKKRRR